MPDVVIFDPRTNYANRVELKNVANLQCSWEVSRIGLMTFDFMLRDLPGGVLPHNQIRRWVEFKHPTAGTWGGVVTSVTVHNGVVSFDCESYAAMLRGLQTVALQGTADVWTAVKRSIENIAAVSGISWGGVIGSAPNPGEPDDSYGVANPTVSAAQLSNGQDTYDFLLAMIDLMYTESAWKSGLRTIGWNINPDTRVLTIDYTYGRYVANTVKVLDGRHVVDSSWTDDATDVYNNVTLTANYNDAYYVAEVGHTQTTQGRCIRKNHHHKCVEWEQISTYVVDVQGYWQPTLGQATVVASNAASIARFGRKDFYAVSPNTFGTRDLVQAHANLVVGALSRNEQLVSAEINNEDAIWLGFREGDAIGVELGNNGRNGVMIVRTRAWDSTRDTMLISGEAVLA